MTATMAMMNDDDAECCLYILVLFHQWRPTWLEQTHFYLTKMLFVAQIVHDALPTHDKLFHIFVVYNNNKRNSSSRFNRNDFPCVSQLHGVKRAYHSALAGPGPTPQPHFRGGDFCIVLRHSTFYGDIEFGPW